MKQAFFVLNLAVVSTVGFVIWNGKNQTSLTPAFASTDQKNESVLLDDVSSSEIAATIAETTRLPESTAVRYQADLEKVRANAPVAPDTAPVKPQIITDGAKSKDDIVTYTVVDGETIADIANRFNVTSDAIRWSNDIPNWLDVSVGQTINIPPQNGIVYKVKEGDTPEALAEKYSANKEQIIAFNDAEISGLPVNEYILIPDGQKPPEPVYNYTYSYVFNSSAVYSGNTYSAGYCTWWAANRRAEIGKPIPSNWGNADQWDDYARAQGYLVDKTPEVGAIVQDEGGWGRLWYIYHVAFVEEVRADGSILVSQMNVGGWGVISSQVITAEQIVRTDLDFIH